MKNKRSIIIIILLSVCSAVISCSGMYKATGEYTIPLEKSQHVVYKDLRLQPCVALIEYDTETIGNLLKVKAKLRNMTTFLINAEIKVKFLDNTGYEINTNDGWQPFILEAGEIKYFERISPSPQAADFRILIQYADNSKP